jgi:hypothetical protein
MLSRRGFPLGNETEAGDTAADPDLVAVRQKCRFQEPLAVEVGTVFAPEVLDGRGGALNDDAGVTT